MSTKRGTFRKPPAICYVPSCELTRCVNMRRYMAQRVKRTARRRRQRE